MRGKGRAKLGIFIANLAGATVFGTVWYSVNIVLGNSVVLFWLGWVAMLPILLQRIAAGLPSTGQLLYEESREYQKALRAERYSEAEIAEAGLDNTTLTVIALLSTTLDIVGPAWGIMLTVEALGGKIDVFSALIVAFVGSWLCQKIAWKCLKRVVAMTWEALQGIATYPFATKTRRRGHSVAFQTMLGVPKDE